MPAKIYTDKDASLEPLKNKTVAVLGFGSQGHAHALNLKESGVNVIIGLYPGSKSRKVARTRDSRSMTPPRAVKLADVIFVAIPDTKQPTAYEKDIKPNLTKGKTLLFSHGFAIHFKTIIPPKDVDVIMVRSQRPRPHRPPPVHRGQGRPRPHRHLPEPQQAGEKDRPRMGQGRRRHPAAA